MSSFPEQDRRQVFARLILANPASAPLIGVAEAQTLKAAAPAATLSILPEMNHVLKQVMSDDLQANMMTYANPDLPLAPGVVEAIVGFVKSQK